MGEAKIALAPFVENAQDNSKPYRAQVYEVLPREILLALIFKVVVKALWINVFVSVDQQDIWDRRLLDEFQYSHSFLRSKKRLNRTRFHWKNRACSHLRLVVLFIV